MACTSTQLPAANAAQDAGRVVGTAKFTLAGRPARHAYSVVCSSLLRVVVFWWAVGLSPAAARWPRVSVCDVRQGPALPSAAALHASVPTRSAAVTGHQLPLCSLAMLISSRGLCFLFRTCKTLSRRLASRNNRANNAYTHLSSSIAVVSARQRSRATSAATRRLCSLLAGGAAS